MGNVFLPSRRSLPTDLPVIFGSPVTPNRSSTSWNAIPTFLPKADRFRISTSSDKGADRTPSVQERSKSAPFSWLSCSSRSAPEKTVGWKQGLYQLPDPHKRIYKK